MGQFMTDPDHRRHDRLSPQMVHGMLTLLTADGGRQHMVRRWVRLPDTSDGFERTLGRLSLTESCTQKLTAELIARRVDHH
jgi:hypothetical protein